MDAFVVKMSKSESYNMGVQDLQLNYFEKSLKEDLQGLFICKTMFSEINLDTELYFVYDKCIVAKALALGKVDLSKEMPKVKNRLSSYCKMYVLDINSIKTFKPLPLDEFYDYVSVDETKEEWIKELHYTGQVKKVSLKDNMYDMLQDRLNIPFKLNDAFYSSPLYQDFFKRNFVGENLLNLTGLYYFENIHSYFLTTLLDKNKNSALGFNNKNSYEPLLKFLKIIAKKDKSGKLNLSKNVVVTDCKIEAQSRINQNNIPDIAIDFSLSNNCSYRLILEAKLESCEGSGQCERYFLETEKKYPDVQKIYVYLSLNDNNVLDGGELINNKYIQITHQELLDQLYYECYEMTYNNLIYDYMQSFNYIMDKLIKEVKINEIPVIKPLVLLASDIYYQYSSYIEKDIIEDNKIPKEELSYILKLLICIYKNKEILKKNKGLKEKIEKFYNKYKD